jgi:hypothetical protein
MASEKQIEANRANAKKSTGPRTGAGRARSRLNSRKHGLTAKTLIIVGEYTEDFDQLRAELMNEHDPQSALECELVERLAGILWRLRRVPLFEAAILDARQAQLAEEDMREDERRTQRWHGYEEEEKEGEDGEDREVEEDEETADWEASVRLGRALIHDGAWGDALGKLARHEATLMNALTKTLLLLEEHRGTQREPVMLKAVTLPAAA